MGLRNRTPNVCSALKSQAFLQEAGLVLIGKKGPRQSTTTTFRYQRDSAPPPDQRPRATRGASATEFAEAGAFQPNPVTLPTARPPPVPDRDMSAVAFDTLTAARDLEAAGIERRQAEAIAGTVRTAAAADRDALATKADLAEIRADLAEFRADTKADLAEFRADMQADLHAAVETLATKNELAEFRAATNAEIAGVRSELAGVRSELGTIRWSVGLIAAFLFAIGLRMFGLI